MDENLKALVAKCWKNELLDLEVGSHYIDEVVTLRISGSVEKQKDAMVAPTTSLPLIPILALFWEKSGIARDHALQLLREAITEAMENGKSKNAQIEAHITDVEKAVKAVKQDLIAKLPKQKRSGRVVTKDLQIAIVPVEEDELATAVA